MGFTGLAKTRGGSASIEARATDAAGNIASVSANMQVNATITPYRALALRGGENNENNEAVENLLHPTPSPPATPKVRTAGAPRDRSGS